MNDHNVSAACKADFDLCNSVCIEIPKLYGDRAPVDSLPVAHRTALLVWSAGGCIDNGGFEYLFEHAFPGDPAFVHTAAAFGTIGCTTVTEIFRRVFALFPNGRVIEDWDARISHYESIPEATREPLNHSFWKASSCGMGEITARLAYYIRRNESAFAKAMPKSRLLRRIWQRIISS